MNQTNKIAKIPSAYRDLTRGCGSGSGAGTRVSVAGCSAWPDPNACSASSYTRGSVCAGIDKCLVLGAIVGFMRIATYATRNPLLFGCVSRSVFHSDSRDPLSS